MKQETNDQANRELREREVIEMQGWECNSARNLVSSDRQFQTTLNRDGEEIEILVTYSATDELCIQCVETKAGKGDILTTSQEDQELRDEVEAHFQRSKIHG